MAKKNLLGSFEFKKLEGLTNGIKIPISNSLKQDDKSKIVVPTNEPIEKKVKKPVNVAKSSSKATKTNEATLPRNYNFEGKGVKQMVNVVPTAEKVVPTKTAKKVLPTKPTKQLSTSLDKPKKEKISFDTSDLDLQEFGAIESKQEKALYLAMRGWSLKVEQRRQTLYHYATKYIKRKKQRIYLGSINNN